MLERKVGDRVTLKKLDFTVEHMVSDMFQYSHRIAIITGTCGRYYKLDIDNGDWCWYDWCFEDVQYFG